MKFKLLAFFIFTFFASYLIGQVTIDINVINEKNRAIKDAHVSINNAVYTTNSEGFVSKSINTASELKISVSHVSHLTYDTLVSIVNQKHLKIEVKLKEYLLPDVIIEFNNNPDTVFGSKFDNIKDFTLIDGYIVLLTYRKKLNKGVKLILLNSLYKKVDEWTSSIPLKNIKKSFDDQCFVIGDDKSFIINIYNQKLVVTPFDKIVYDKEISRLTDKINSDIIWNNFRWDYPAFSYFLYQKLLKENTLFYAVKDSFQMNMLRASYKDLSFRQRLNAFKKEIESGIDKEVVGGFMSGYQNTMYYEEPLAPLFVLKDSIYLFDFTKQTMLVFDEMFNKKQVHKLTFHEEKVFGKWQKELFVDEVSNNVYAHFKSDNFHLLWSVSLTSSKLIRKTVLSYQFVEKILIKNGWVYYLYRPFGSVQKNFLYKERLF